MRRRDTNFIAIRRRCAVHDVGIDGVGEAKLCDAIVTQVGVLCEEIEDRRLGKDFVAQGKAGVTVAEGHEVESDKSANGNRKYPSIQTTIKSPQDWNETGN